MKVMNKIALTACLIWVLAMMISSCAPDKAGQQNYIQYTGKTMGTTYSVKLKSVGEDLQPGINKALEDVNMALSTYIPESLISRYNQSGRLDIKIDALAKHFDKNMNASLEIYEGSQGAFDPTVGPLINAWGFGWEGRQPMPPSKEVVDSLLNLVGMSGLIYHTTGDSLHLKAAKPGMQLDFSAIAKGYGVDVVAELLEGQGVGDYFVEIGGEVRTKGMNPLGQEWIVGVSTPDEKSPPTAFYTKVTLSGQSMATSGNYRNYYLVEGQKVWHTIDPVTGYPEQNPMLSASIVHDNCMEADAIATACLVMGAEKCIEFVKSKDAAAYLIVNDGEDGMRVVKTGFDKYLINQ